MTQRKTRFDRMAVAFFDFLFILILLFLCVAFFFFARPRELAGNDTDLLYTVRFPCLRAEYATDIHTGDSVLDAVGKRQIGEVVSYSVTPALTETYDRTSGKMRRAAYPGRVTLTLSIRAKARQEEQGWSLSGLKLLRGTHLPLRLPNFSGVGTCTATEAHPLNS